MKILVTILLLTIPVAFFAGIASADPSFSPYQSILLKIFVGWIAYALVLGSWLGIGLVWSD